MSKCKPAWGSRADRCFKASCPDCGVRAHPDMPTIAPDCSCKWEVAGLMVIQTRNERCPDHGDELCTTYIDSDRNELHVADKRCPLRGHKEVAEKQDTPERREHVRFWLRNW